MKSSREFAWESSEVRHRACVVWIDFTPPSVKHVPSMLRIHGRTCLTVLLERLRGYFGTQFEYHVVCWNDHVSDRILAEVSWPDVKVFRSSAPSTSAALSSFCSAHPNLEEALFFSANAVLTDFELADRMLAHHLSVRADVCLARDLPPGIGPVFTMKLPASKATEGQFKSAGSILELARSLGSVVARSQDDQLKIVDYDWQSDKDLIPEQLPVSALISDEPSRLSSERALEQCPDRYDAQPAYAFKQAKIAIDRNPRATRRHITPRYAPRTILFSSLWAAFSGGEESLFSLIANLDRSKFYPIAVFPFETTLAEKLEQSGVSVEIAGWDYTECGPTNLRYCEDLMNEYKPALVHVDGFVNPALMVTAYARRIKIVGHLRMFIGSNLPPAGYLAERIITVSNAIANNARRNNIDPKTVVRIYNGVKTDQLGWSNVDRSELHMTRGIPEKARVICMVARVTRFKRPDLLIEALPKILAAVPSAHAVFVGEPFAHDLEYYSFLQATIESSGLKHHVTWWGFEKFIGRVYRISDVMVHCNRQEPLARCMIEALSVGLPIVAPNGGGSPEVIQDGYNGFLYTPDCAESLAEAVIRILADDCLRNNMAQAALTKSQEFTIERHVKSVEALYHELLEAGTH